jgi:hypothetical protein
MHIMTNDEKRERTERTFSKPVRMCVVACVARKADTATESMAPYMESESICMSRKHERTYTWIATQGLVHDSRRRFFFISSCEKKSETELENATQQFRLEKSSRGQHFLDQRVYTATYV